MKQITLGILAHVDAGKTTLSEAMLYTAGTLHKLGRVDNRDTFLDNGEQERKRGITITAKHAAFSLKDANVTLIDTPGHTDFASEAEAVLPVLDCAVLLISPADGVTAHTETLWKLLARHRVPTFVFINKIDLPGRDPKQLLAELSRQFGQGFLDMSDGIDCEQAAMCSEALMEAYLAYDVLEDAQIRDAVANRAVFPCFFGSALKMQGVDRLLDALERWAPTPCSDREQGLLGARVFKISHDEKGNRLTHLKLTSGTLRARTPISLRSKKGEVTVEKVDRILVHDGKTEQVREEIGAGEVAVLTGLSATWVGQGIGWEAHAEEATLVPVTSYRVALPSGCGAFEWLPKLKKLEEENPMLRLAWVERTGEIRVSLTGEVQTEVLIEEIRRRFGITVRIENRSILYRETIRKTVEGVGHFEPLRHYAEVHLLLEPLERGAGLQIGSSCPPQKLSVGWQRSILDILHAQTLTGVLTNSPLTDMRITLISGRSHPKHTEAGDFMQATMRALRQGLMRAEALLLEPHYRFRLSLPTEALGRAMTDLDSMGGECEAPIEENGSFTLCGHAPVSALHEYLPLIPSYTHGKGRVFVKPGDYLPCPLQEEVVRAIGYRPEADPDHPADSIFCKNGAGYSVPWQQAEGYMHVPTRRRERSAEKREQDRRSRAKKAGRDFDAEDRELMAIFERTYGPIRRRKLSEPRRIAASEAAAAAIDDGKVTEYLLVDAYNVIFAWEELRDAAEESLDLARNMLTHLMMNYQGFRGCRLILVFDAYRTGGVGDIEDQGGVVVVYTREAETADSFIERTVYLLGETGKKQKRTVRVVTSDGAEQLIVLGSGAIRVSAEQFREEVARVDEEIAQILERLRKEKE